MIIANADVSVASELTIETWYFILQNLFADLVSVSSQGVQEADKPEEGFYIRSGIVVIVKSATIKDGTVI